MNYLKTILVLFITTTLSTSSFAQRGIYKSDQNIAINGFDVVAYFKAYKAVRGNDENTHNLNGTTYYFSSNDNAVAFKKNPQIYLPQYGGYCAFAMGMKGANVPSDPKTFKIRDGKLYLFFNDYYEGKPFNTIIPWNGSEPEMVDKANSNWKGRS